MGSLASRAVCRSIGRSVALGTVLLAACTSDGGVTVFDGGSRDARDAEIHDEGPALADAPAAMLDAEPAADADTVELGPGETDTGPVESDVGPADTDTGPVEADAGPSCVAEPTCGLVPQCGCAAGQMCDIDDLRTGARHCIAAGADRELGPCSTGTCAPGLRCLGDGADALCGRYCVADSDCTPGAECVNLAWVDSTGLHPTPGAHVCTVACDPVAQTGCPAGYGCAIGYSLRAGALVGSAGCTPSGVQGLFAPCDASARCAPGLMCVSTGAALRCEAICDVARPSSCPASLTCAAPSMPLVIRGVAYGLCSSG